VADPGPLQILADRAAAFLAAIAQARISGEATGAKTARFAAGKFFSIGLASPILARFCNAIRHGARVLAASRPARDRHWTTDEPPLSGYIF
jgi:hypothetical protein